ncbi:hypothetical protein BDV29DRAFT_173484 [Aspergillus leporis]|uniref:Uncharacterized protein n=1 Tax=Aspergillus leporis TaxID=41062 RepID=A0A5N5X188_9EURO|nr:hypothetical protein BDV29DRAFT_173484 [Aspergillus leporis]
MPNYDRPLPDCRVHGGIQRDRISRWAHHHNLLMCYCRWIGNNFGIIGRVLRDCYTGLANRRSGYSFFFFFVFFLFLFVINRLFDLF